MKLDPERVAGFIADIRQSSSRLRIIGSISEEEFLTDPDAQDIARSRLLTAVQAPSGSASTSAPRNSTTCRTTMPAVSTSSARRAPLMRDSRRVLCRWRASAIGWYTSTGYRLSAGPPDHPRRSSRPRDLRPDGGEIPVGGTRLSVPTQDLPLPAGRIYSWTRALRRAASDGRRVGLRAERP